jgi:hypothetical protein
MPPTPVGRLNNDVVLEVIADVIVVDRGVEGVHVHASVAHDELLNWPRSLMGSSFLHVTDPA